MKISKFNAWLAFVGIFFFCGAAASGVAKGEWFGAGVCAITAALIAGVLMHQIGKAIDKINCRVPQDIKKIVEEEQNDGHAKG